MTPKLSEDQRQALLHCPDGPVSIEDEKSHRFYVIVDEQVHQKAMSALRQQEDLSAVRAGIAEMEAGRVIPLEEVDARIRERLGIAPRA